nr:MAG TPA: hypothetical protein [Caudoviricetes sp.]
MAFKGLSDYTNKELLAGGTPEEAQLYLAYRKAQLIYGLNTLVFGATTDIDPAGVSGSRIVKVSYIDGLTGATGRKIGQKGKSVNVVRSTETVEMSTFNSTFDVDRTQTRTANENSRVIADNMNDCTYSVAQLFLQNLFKGKIGDDIGNGVTLAWNGIDYYFGAGKALHDMDNATPLALPGGVTDQASAIKFGTHLGNSINKMGVNTFTEVWTTSAGLSQIQAYNLITNAGIRYVKVGDTEYMEFMGKRVVAVPDSYFDSTLLTKGIPFYFIRSVKDKTGFAVITLDGKIFDPLVPKLLFNNDRVEQGSNEMTCVPVPCTTECVARCLVSTAVAVAADTKG